MKLSAILLVFTLAFFLAFPAGASASTAVSDNSVVSIDLTGPDGSDQLWKITMKATVVSNQKNALVVYLANPQNTAIQNGDHTGHLQTIPVNSDTTVTDAQGNNVDLTAVLPTQEIRVTFLYYWRSNTVPGSLVPHSCLEVSLIGETKTAKSFVTVDSFDKDTLIGTVLTVQNGQVELYVESGRVFHGDTEYHVRGVQRFTSGSSTVYDADGRAVSVSRLHPMQRILVTAGDALWMESYPPQYALQSAQKIVLLNEDEQIFRPNELSELGSMTCTVQELIRDANGNIQLVVQPVEHSREGSLCDQFIMPASPGSVYGSNGAPSTFGSIRSGMTLRVSYTGLIYSSDPGLIPWYSRIDILP